MKENNGLGQYSRRELLRLAGLSSLGLAAPSFLTGCGDDGNSGFMPPSYAATILDARIAIAQAMADTQTPSISVALCDGERIIWRETFGYVDQAQSVPPGLDTLYCIGSCSKVVAAVAAMILVDRGQIELDAPLVDYVTDFRMADARYRDITVRMLLSHSSGLPGSHARNLFTFTPVLDYAAQVQHDLATERLKHAPGEMAVYCNDGFTLIERLVMAVTGQSYPRFVQDEILTPLGMRQSRFALTLFPAGAYAPAFREDGALWPQECTNAYASGGLYTTPNDMTRLARMFINGGEFEGVRILSKAALTEMGRDQTTPLTFNPIPNTRWGLGWDGVAQPGLAAVGVTTWHKNGGTQFYRSDFFVASEERLAVLITGTSMSYPSDALAERILLNALAERGRIARVPAPLPEDPPPEQAATDADLAAMVGFYANHYEGLLRIEAQPDRTLTIQQYNAGVWSPYAADLKRRVDGSFASDTQPLTAYWTFNADGCRYLAQRTQKGMGHYLTEMPWAQRVEPAADLSPAWQTRVGQRWLWVNESDQSVLLASYPPVVTLEKGQELPGYLLGPTGIVDPSGDDRLARMFLKIPVLQGRDLNDVVMEMRDGEEWLRCGGQLFRPQASVPVLAAGDSAVIIDAEGLAEWRKLPTTGSSANLTGASAWKLYDADLTLLASGNGNGPTGANPTGAYLLLYGAPNAAITVAVMA